MIDRRALVFPARPVVLVGMMGSGKTTLGERLATRYGVPFFDSDKELENRTGQSAKDYFLKQGEAAFRALECEIMAELLQKPASILAAAGGAMMAARTRQIVKEKAISVWVRVPLKENLNRALQRTDRPPLQGGDAREKFLDLYAQREPVYRQADIIIENCGLVDDVVRQIIDVLNQFCAPAKSEESLHG